MNVRWIFKNGLIGGAIAGIIFAMVEMMSSFITKGTPFGPLKMIAGIPLQQSPQSIDLGNAFLFGIGFHMILSMMYGVIVAFLIDTTGWLKRSTFNIVMFTTFFGFAIWILNFYILGPLLNAPWFAQQTNPVLQFLWHTFFFGTIIGIYFALKRSQEVKR